MKNRRRHIVSLKMSLFLRVTFVFFKISVGNTNAYKYGESRAGYAHVNGFANMNFKKQKICGDFNATLNL